MAQIAKAIFCCKLLFCVADGAGDVDQNDMSAFFANEMVVVFVGIAQLIVTA